MTTLLSLQDNSAPTFAMLAPLYLIFCISRSLAVFTNAKAPDARI
jgi:hypothetical protein